MKIYLIITNKLNGLSKKIDVTEYTNKEFKHTASIYSKNFDVKVMIVNNSYKLPHSVEIKLILETHKYKLCETCMYNFCGCSVQDSIIKVETDMGNDVPSFDDFGCNKHKYNPTIA